MVRLRKRAIKIQAGTSSPVSRFFSTNIHTLTVRGPSRILRVPGNGLRNSATPCALLSLGSSTTSANARDSLLAARITSVRPTWQAAPTRFPHTLHSVSLTVSAHPYTRFRPSIHVFPLAFYAVEWGLCAGVVIEGVEEVDAERCDWVMVSIVRHASAWGKEHGRNLQLHEREEVLRSGKAATVLVHL
ncbi:hypothetical protein B0H16DRAFT_1462046 [Mycena metata]|uniref:Uncharacterized protein n=1 Tax=Mycena metata TaxID=1033252 RepID=A0AAD7IP81_9AGAR|nr:hypothetical protein B0H16DRAFT_1462046 [Mycena metata]